MNTTEIIKEEVKGLSVLVEKLDGGFISDIEGKRKIYRDQHDLADVINIDDLLNQSNDGEYHLSINLVPKDQYEENRDLASLIASDIPQEEEMTYEEAKARGIIQGVDKFDPNFKVEPEDIKDIKITARNAYSPARLKSIDWNDYHERLVLDHSQRVQISGMSNQAMYNQWRKALKGTASFHLSKTRISMTILAKYYEANLDIRTSSKDQLELMKDKMLEMLAEFEIVAKEKKYIKSSVILDKMSKMKKVLS